MSMTWHTDFLRLLISKPMGTPTGLEPATFGETVQRSSQIELRGDIKDRDVRGFEPLFTLIKRQVH